jgi:hypothetical protein
VLYIRRRRIINWIRRRPKIWGIPWTFDRITNVWFMVFNASLNNISVISWRSVLLVEETRVPGENHRPVASHWQTLCQIFRIFQNPHLIRTAVGVASVTVKTGSHDNINHILQIIYYFCSIRHHRSHLVVNHQHYVIKFVSDLLEIVDCFLRVNSFLHQLK